MIVSQETALNLLKIYAELNVFLGCFFFFVAFNILWFKSCHGFSLLMRIVFQS